MDWKGWLRTVLGISVLLGIADMLLPKGGTAKFCKLVLGLTLMLAVLQPISNLFSLNPVSVDLDWPGQGLSEPEINSIAARVQLAGARSALRADGGALATQIESLLLDETGLSDVKIEVYSGPGGPAALVLVEPFSQRLKEEVQKIMGTVLNLKAEQIEVRELAGR